MKKFSLRIVPQELTDHAITVYGLSQEEFHNLKNNHDELEKFLLKKCVTKHNQTAQSFDELEISWIEFHMSNDEEISPTTIIATMEYTMPCKEPETNQHWETYINNIPGKVRRHISAQVTFYDSTGEMLIQVPSNYQSKIMAMSGRVIMKELILSRFNKFRDKSNWITDFSALNVKQAVISIKVLITADIPITETQMMRIHETREFAFKTFQY